MVGATGGRTRTCALVSALRKLSVIFKEEKRYRCCIDVEMACFPLYGEIMAFRALFAITPLSPSFIRRRVVRGEYRRGIAYRGVVIVIDFVRHKGWGEARLRGQGEDGRRRKKRRRKKGKGYYCNVLKLGIYVHLI